MSETDDAVMVMRLDAENDRNGNPRRVYVVLRANGGIKACYDEGYAGLCAIPERYRKLPYAGTFRTTPAERRNLIKNFPPIK